LYLKEVAKLGNRKKRRNDKLHAFDTGGQSGRQEPLGTGDRTVVSGIYQVLDHPHFSEGELFLRKASLLPSCPVCGEPARFRLEKKIVHIGEDPDFGG
jgi:hypothetical protein